MMGACSMATAYQPDLLPLADTPAVKVFIDKKSVGKIKSSPYVKANIFERYAQPVTDGQTGPYQLAIKQYVLDCKAQQMAVSWGAYYQGQEPDSERVGGFDNSLRVNGDNGQVTHHLGDLEFYPRNVLQQKASLAGITPFYGQIFKFLCKS